MIPFVSRVPALRVGAFVGLLAAAPALAQNKDDTKPAPAPAASGRFEEVTVNGQPTPPVELRATLKDGATTCSPQVIRIPADGAVDLRIRNDANQILTLSSPELFAHGRQVRFDGQIAHAVSETAYTIKPGSDGRVVVHTPKPGEYPYTCAVTGDSGTPFQGTVNAVGAN